MGNLAQEWIYQGHPAWFEYFTAYASQALLNEFKDLDQSGMVAYRVIDM